MAAPFAGIGHNGGPDMTGTAWRKHCWQAAREALLPHLPIEVLRGRVRRAQELGLDYKTYASVRAASGHDVVAFLFSSNALRVTSRLPQLPEDRVARLQSMAQCGRLALAVAPLAPAALMAAGQGLLDAAQPAPRPFGSFAEAREAIRLARGAHKPDGVILVGAAPFEAEWCAAGKLGFYLPAERIFA
ncbi:hypothetical protein [Gemmobacter serpentinus]|uniref:hypothetical protein n=1 Tax=Gemmobacter serpentinus TaxID=2652247 RepID=UPI00124F41AB|nr:hypothetical protein [Gemmobacter serpentinus]